jgi:hypothetical protein
VLQAVTAHGTIAPAVEGRLRNVGH